MQLCRNQTCSSQSDLHSLDCILQWPSSPCFFLLHVMKLCFPSKIQSEATSSEIPWRSSYEWLMKPQSTLARGSYCTYFLLYVGFVFVWIRFPYWRWQAPWECLSSLGTLLATYCDCFQLLDVIGRRFVTHVKWMNMWVKTASKM